MATPILYGFIVDESLRQPKQLDLTGASDQGYGVLSGECENYFVAKANLGDTRNQRLRIVDSHPATGNLSVHFDANRFDTDILANMSDIEHTLFFNILERIYLHQEYTDANIEHVLTTTSEYNGYVRNTLMHDTNEAEVVINCPTGTADEPRKITLHNWYGFEFETENTHFKVHLWVSKSAFAKEYPYTTITRVIPPCEPAALVDPATLLQQGNINVLMNSSSYVFDEANLETAVIDQNGVYKYSTKYVIDSSRTVQLSFGLAYCGANVPSTLECRKAIRSYLEEHTSLAQEYMEALFPELYVNARFFVMPLWDLYSQQPDRVVYNSIFSYKKIDERIKLLFPDATDDFLKKYLEFLLNAQNKMLSVCLPDELNDELFSILEQHPTYQDYSSNVSGWKFMLAETQEFAGKLNRGFSILNGESTSNEFVETEISNRKYLSFTSGKSEYLILTEDSYQTIMKNL